LENQMCHHGTVSSQAEEQIREEYRELFLPAETKWREKAIADGRQAFQGILSAYQLL
jgi:hypothetical protein